VYHPKTSLKVKTLVPLPHEYKTPPQTVLKNLGITQLNEMQGRRCYLA
jgi:hypothetical protein